MISHENIQEHLRKPRDHNIRKLKPMLRSDAASDLRSRLFHMLSSILEDNTPIYKSCLNCANFKEQTETCTLTNGLRPPARTIAYGCKQWEDIDEIPF